MPRPRNTEHPNTGRKSSGRAVLPRPGVWQTIAMATLSAAIVLRAEAPAHASTRWSSDVAARLDDAWPDIEAAAELAGVDPLALAAQGAVETGAQPIEGWYEPVLGSLQVNPSVWRWLLAGARYDDADLADPVWTWHAAAEVMLFQRIVYRREGALLQCLWSDGIKALQYSDDCLYSRQVVRMRRLVVGHRRLPSVEDMRLAALAGARP